jgi:hypothetical protein
MLQRAYDEGLVKNRPEDVVHFVPTAEEAIRWIEEREEKGSSGEIPAVKKRSTILKEAQSFMSPPAVPNSKSFSKSSSSEGLTWRDGKLVKLSVEDWKSLAWNALPFVAGIAVGLVSAVHLRSRPHK